MAEQEVKEVKESKKKSEQVSFSIEDFQQLVAAAVVAAQSAGNAGLADAVARAVVEARKPVADPNKEASEAQMRESSRINREREKQAMKIAQDNCPHKQGCNALSSFSGPLSSFVIHVLDTGLPVAICTNCLKVVKGDTEDPEDAKIFRVKSGNQVSSAGQRFFRDPLAAMKAGQ